MNYFKNLSIKGKLVWLSALFSAFTLIVGCIAFFSLKKVNGNYEHVVEVNVPNLETISVMRLAQKDVIISVSPLFTGSHTGESVAKQKEKIDKAIATWEEAAKKYEAVTFVEGEAPLWERIKKGWPVFKERTQKFLSLASTGNKADEMIREQLAKGEYADIRNELIAAYGALVDFQDNQTEVWSKESQSAAKDASIGLIFVSVAGLLTSMIVGLIFASVLSKGLSNIASGIDTGATEVASASEEIASASTELSASATEQAAALQETVASIDEVSAMVSKNADNAKKSLEVAASSQSVAARGKQSVDEMVRSMDEINSSNNEIMQQIEASNREISEIVKVISEIGNKTKVINDIVFQTKLLSFNASVEAARAGEHGKGFAVVAEEVGNLAQMSGNAAKEISQMLDGSIQKVEGIVNNTKSKVDKLVAAGKAKVEGGTAVARRCGEVLDEIVGNVTELNHMVSEISTASTEQSQGVGEITKAMGQLDQVTQQNAAASQQASSAGEKMMIQATDLRTAVENLMATINGVSAQKMVKPMVKKEEPKGTVLPFQPKSSLKEVQVVEASKTNTVFKKAVGAENPPAENDPRFEDV